MSRHKLLVLGLVSSFLVPASSWVAGCAGVKKLPPYEGPFEAGHEYAANAPVSVGLGDTPFEPGASLEGVPPERTVHDPDVLPPGTRFRFVRKDASYLVFLVESGDARGRYAWVPMRSEDVQSFEAVP